MKIEHLQGLISAPFAPFNGNGKLDTNLIPSYYAFLKKNGITGAFINGSTGEGVSLTLEEKKEVAQAWADCTNHDADFKVMVFLGGTCLADCIDLAKHAYEIGLYAVSLTAPFYFKPANVDMLAQACIMVGESIPGMPLYYYHIPVLTGVNVPMYDLLKALDGKLPNFAGVKYTHEDFMDYQSCMSYQNGKYDMLWGRDENMLSALVLGAKGSVGSTFNYAAPLYYDLIAAFNANDLVKARELQQKSIDMIRLLGKYGGISVGKAYMKVTGIDLGEFRLPVKNMSAEQFESFKIDVESLNFDDFKSK
ncbi:dihydrodipicolinate synthase family protein [Flavobacterium sp.]|jgi:N-acetylneuraminate lyase|uniref:dihydrodipicolinate synthase family protein n=1 Tax=Flavobacterium sp. TaxID=239 RepID=UPI001B567D44|nr:dihydrodipicolinate synthase family protein [Flavobacterium sp.]MBP6182787.1 dihydrodipicolinate synthase family protein [Flavobacterium sp.]